MDIQEKLLDFYNYEIPDYVKGAGKTYLIINFGNEWNESVKPRKIKITDVARYYATQANNIIAGCRTLAGVTGDWRCIDGIAKECLEWFKVVNIEALKRGCRKLELEPKF